MKMITIGILPQEQMRARTLSIAKGELKRKPGDPRIWFTSMRSLAEVLSDENRALLKVISDMHGFNCISNQVGCCRAACW